MDAIAVAAFQAALILGVCTGRVAAVDKVLVNCVFRDEIRGRLVRLEIVWVRIGDGAVRWNRLSNRATSSFRKHSGSRESEKGQKPGEGMEQGREHFARID